MLRGILREKNDFLPDTNNAHESTAKGRFVKRFKEFMMFESHSHIQANTSITMQYITCLSERKPPSKSSSVYRVAFIFYTCLDSLFELSLTVSGFVGKHVIKLG